MMRAIESKAEYFCAIETKKIEYAKPQQDFTLFADTILIYLCQVWIMQN